VAGIPRSATQRSEIMTTNTGYAASMEKQMKKWDSDVDALAAAGEKANAEAQKAYHKSVKELRANRDAAQKTFLEMQSASQSTAAKMQAKMEASWDTMQKALAKVSSDLKK
jgi:hypothetical protein